MKTTIVFFLVLFSFQNYAQSKVVFKDKLFRTTLKLGSYLLLYEDEEKSQEFKRSDLRKSLENYTANSDTIFWKLDSISMDSSMILSKVYDYKYDTINRKTFRALPGKEKRIYRVEWTNDGTDTLDNIIFRRAGTYVKKEISLDDYYLIVFVKSNYFDRLQRELSLINVILFPVFLGKVIIDESFAEAKNTGFNLLFLGGFIAGLSALDQCSIRRHRVVQDEYYITIE